MRDGSMAADSAEARLQRLGRFRRPGSASHSQVHLQRLVRSAECNVPLSAVTTRVERHSASLSAPGTARELWATTAAPHQQSSSPARQLLLSSRRSSLDLATYRACVERRAAAAQRQLRERCPRDEAQAQQLRARAAASRAYGDGVQRADLARHVDQVQQRQQRRLKQQPVAAPAAASPTQTSGRTVSVRGAAGRPPPASTTTTPSPRPASSPSRTQARCVSAMPRRPADDSQASPQQQPFDKATFNKLLRAAAASGRLCLLPPLCACGAAHGGDDGSSVSVLDGARYVAACCANCPLRGNVAAWERLAWAARVTVGVAPPPPAPAPRAAAPAPGVARRVRN